MKTWILACTRQGSLAEQEKEEQLWVLRTAQASLIRDIEAEIQARIKARCHKYNTATIERKK